jgi:hypothetical protein
MEIANILSEVPDWVVWVVILIILFGGWIGFGWRRRP